MFITLKQDLISSYSRAGCAQDLEDALVHKSLQAIVHNEFC